MKSSQKVSDAAHRDTLAEAVAAGKVSGREASSCGSEGLSEAAGRNANAGKPVSKRTPEGVRSAQCG
ncbi:MAG: hypothetical protein ACKVHE_09280, partial [Planctomycetales bacterium]